jgi:hypothetical protein
MGTATLLTMALSIPSLTASQAANGAGVEHANSASSCSPGELALTSISKVTTSATQTVKIHGCGLGGPNSFSNSTSLYFDISDITGNWNACWSGQDPNDRSAITCSVSSWTDTEIVFSGFDFLGSDLLKNGDVLDVIAWNPQSGAGATMCLVTVGKPAKTCR